MSSPGLESKQLQNDLAAPFSIDEFLAQERGKDLFRFSTAGSVDDGKSTLIGRLLYDTRSVYDDHVRSIEGKGTTGAGQLDFALLTDGLRAEREQGITIDVAYRYFATARRKFIIADTPGHEQYTRNMATGASTADAAIVLVDARKGVLIQSRRHAYIASLLGVRHILVAVNKMDLVDYSQQVFDEIQREFAAFLESASAGNLKANLYFLPVSALLGVNVVHRSPETPWYTGPSLLELLESLPSVEGAGEAALRFPVQRVVRPNQNFRGFAGQIASGTVRVGDDITVLPSGRSSRVERIVTFDGDLAEAPAPLSVTLTLEDELDISRGDLITHSDSQAQLARRFDASLVWMDAEALDPERRYLLKHTSHSVPVRSLRVLHRVDVGTLDQSPAVSLAMNEIGVVEIETRRPLALDRYADLRSTGAFVLIDAKTNATVAAGMVRALHREELSAMRRGPVTPELRAQRWGHEGMVVELTGPAELADVLEHALFDLGAVTVRALQRAPGLHAALTSAGVLVLVHQEGPAPAELSFDGGASLTVETDDLNAAVAALIRHLREHKVLQ
ncbi:MULTISPECIES: sulfate adenylyltransferase subunit CysN [Acidobacterium]|uniref:Sulfate adenylyltransferase subunit 1 n=1 Tax=Acidobacterium capsulatum (strain ATCC 51196 / DSM 11244 / BCRC 80197 / JCM 7670 / NBRC 15755 / NCIMB 13165 / 161) TaxID=240015 RepID=C1F7S2_ACIC5|nr:MULTISPECIES: sulfate adenylyltransferase subunit CysN [Acidobacterium]ACO32049.1 sulfate adenylyltransferase, large subunit [Acidobacterium capsulatum ATCC 51196]HCT59688.1 sulfate adenylyltransferase subunit CysN [Acidobacterium sp.]